MLVAVGSVPLENSIIKWLSIQKVGTTATVVTKFALFFFSKGVQSPKASCTKNEGTEPYKDNLGVRFPLHKLYPLQLI